jgi:hypothetical protein
MSALVKRVVEQLKSAKSLNDLESCAWVASDLLRKFQSIGYHSGFPEIDQEEVTEEEKLLIQKSLIEALSSSSDPKFVSSILSALGSARDRTLQPLFVNYLGQYLKQLKWSNGVVSAALMGLHELGEDVYEENSDGSTSHSVIDVDKNIRQAQQYLQKFDVMVPW